MNGRDKVLFNYLKPSHINTLKKVGRLRSAPRPLRLLYTSYAALVGFPRTLRTAGESNPDDPRDNHVRASLNPSAQDLGCITAAEGLIKNYLTFYKSKNLRAEREGSNLISPDCSLHSGRNLTTATGNQILPKKSTIMKKRVPLGGSILRHP